MYAVIFEAEPTAEGKAEYLDIAGRLRPELETVDGFESLANPGKVLSLSFWRDEEAVRTWRERRTHRSAQARGRAELFAEYRIRVARVVRDYDKDSSPWYPAT